MKKAANETSKAEMIAEKDRAIVLAARENFLRDGFAGACMDRIAKAAGVSVKTIYSHFENKNELFSKVMIATCDDPLPAGQVPLEDVLSERYSWFTDATEHGLTGAGTEYLRHLLSDEQLALYRVVTRDADRFPELGLQYQRKVAQGRTRLLTAWFRRAASTNAWANRDSAQDAALHEALLRVGIYEEALHGVVSVDPDVLDKQALSASKTMWKLLAAGWG